jgi:hypothetical protein
MANFKAIYFSQSCRTMLLSSLSPKPRGVVTCYHICATVPFYYRWETRGCAYNLWGEWWPRIMYYSLFLCKLPLRLVVLYYSTMFIVLKSLTNFSLYSSGSRPFRKLVLLSFTLLHVLPQCHRDFMRLKKGRDKLDDIAKPFAKLPSPGSLLLLCELTHIATCDTSNTENFCTNLWWGLRYIFKPKMRCIDYRKIAMSCKSQNVLR